MMNKRRLPAYNLLRTLFSVGAAFVFGAFLQPLGLPELLFVAVLSLLAGCISHFILNTPRPFSFLASALPLGVYILAMIALPPWVLFSVFIFFFAMHLPALWTHVPYYPSPTSVDAVLIDLIIQQGCSHVVDLGCGNGRLLSVLAKRFPEVKFHGCEISLLPFLVAKLRTILLPNVHIYFRSMWRMPLADFDLIYVFLSPAVMGSVGSLVRQQKKLGSIFISNSFPVPESLGWQSSRIIELGQERGEVLYCYQ
jgi:hypothetical protein